ncbi:hypothetical protein ACFKHW_28560 [Bradyrhizobium lupini]|uniref:hypothetical protein n=1 Tax=Rhizobium lupini TaxID=136996 RepID=UPI00366CC7C5
MDAKLRTLLSSLSPVARELGALPSGRPTPDDGCGTLNTNENPFPLPGIVMRSAIAALEQAHRSAERDAGGSAPFLALLRMVVIASSEATARSLAAPAYETWLKSFKFVYELNDIPPPSNLPLSLDAAIHSELCVVGTGTSVRQTLLDHLEEAGANYLLCQLAFGSLTVNPKAIPVTSFLTRQPMATPRPLSAGAECIYKAALASKRLPRGFDPLNCITKREP